MRGINYTKKYYDKCWKEKERELRKEINKKYYKKRKFKTVQKKRQTP